MPSRNESSHAIARLQLETPISDDASLFEVQEQAAEYVREARRRAPSEPDELVCSVMDAIARDYFRHAIEKQRRRARRALPVLLVLSALTLFAVPAIAQTDYDGAWTVTVVTKRQLSGNAGSGRWNSASAGMPCSGRWMATRQ